MLFFGIFMKKLSIFLCFLFIFVGFGCNFNQPVFTYAVWWWNDELDNSYIDFASQNNINQIYYCNSSFEETTAQFIMQAKNKNIKVFWLAGEYQWLEDNSNLILKINNYINFNSQFPNSKFCGIHLDIEPHQHPDFKTNRSQLIFNLINLANTLKLRFPKINFNYDIPFWLDDELTFNNQTKPAYAHLIDIADQITIMSYRDTAQKIYDVSSQEIAYAKSINKTLVLGVETKSNEGDNVSFMEEGKQIMQTELNILKEMLPQNFGICIHHIKSWYDLKD